MHPIDYAIVVVYLSAIVGIGLWLQKRASSGIDSYFLGNRSIPWWALGASGMASNLDVTGTMINTAFIFALGASGFFIEIRGGVTLIMAFLMIFMGKWNRRAKVMTLAEWMHFRFGKNKEGDVARLISAISSIVVTIAMVTYFAVGSGKFIGTLLGIPDVGQISDGLDNAEKVQIEQRLQSLEMNKEALVSQLDALQTMEGKKKNLRFQWEQLTRSWSALKNNPHNAVHYSAFDADIGGAIGILNSCQQSLEKMESGDLQASAKAAIEKLLAQQSSLRAYFVENTGFFVIYSRFIASTLMIILAMIYTVASGLYGVVWTDVFQGVLIFGTIIIVCAITLFKSIPAAFEVSVPMSYGGFQSISTNMAEWSSILPKWTLSMPEDSSYSIYNLFGIAILFYLIKVTIEGSGGTGGYMIQRYFAARSDREAGLLSLFWTFLLSFRWPFIVAIALLGIYKGGIADPESVLPSVIKDMIPLGVKGLLIAGLMAAAMSTFDSTVNAGAAYWVKDIFQSYLKPGASEKQLVRQSRWASIVIVLVGLLFSLMIRNINEIWGWITMSIGAGMIVPQLIRWYWWRLNGYGFAIGIAAGMVAAILQKAFLPGVPEYVSFSIASGTSLMALLIGTLATKPTDDSVLIQFYKTTRPFGVWRHVRRSIPEDKLKAVHRENKRDIISVFMAVPWQVILFLTWMAAIMKRWDSFTVLLILLMGLSTGLYFTWFRQLSKEVELEA